MKIDGGATIWARQTIDSEIFYNKPDKWFKIWFYLINKVNHTDNKRFKEGCCFLKYDWIMNATGATKDQVKHCIAYLKATSMLATRKATRGFTVEVLKYNNYQNLDNYKSHTKSQFEATQKPHRSHTILKKGNKDKKDKQFKELYANYPNRDSIKKSEEHFNASVNTEKDWQDINTALVKYKKHLTVETWKRPKSASTWFNNWRDWVDYVEPKKPQQAKEHRPDYLDNDLGGRK